ncbi:MAG: hypothetical protein RR465_05575, partial [Mucinivorans sp.]
LVLFLFGRKIRRAERNQACLKLPRRRRIYQKRNELWGSGGTQTPRIEQTKKIEQFARHAKLAQQARPKPAATSGV